MKHSWLGKFPTGCAEYILHYSQALSVSYVVLGNVYFDMQNCIMLVSGKVRVRLAHGAVQKMAG